MVANMATLHGRPDTVLPSTGPEFPASLTVFETEAGPCVGVYDEVVMDGEVTSRRALLLSGWRDGGMVAESHVDTNGGAACHEYGFNGRIASWIDETGEKHSFSPQTPFGSLTDYEVHRRHWHVLHHWMSLLERAGTQNRRQYDAFLPFGGLARWGVVEMARRHRFRTEASQLAVEGLGRMLGARLGGPAALRRRSNTPPEYDIII
jgi:hypothetical protein